MQSIQKLRQSILAGIEQPAAPGSWYQLRGAVTGGTIQTALDRYGSVEVPDTGAPVALDRPLILASGRHLRAAPGQVFLQGRGCETCLVRNEHIQDGAYGVTDRALRDRDISVEGGIWNIRTGQRCWTDPEKSMRGALGGLIFSGVERISLRNMEIFDSPLCGPRGTAASSYGLQLSDCRSFTVENIGFRNNSRDGVHINGPAEYGLVRHIRGGKMGDDIVAVNAWDWDTSALTFGTIENLVVEDVRGEVNEFRLHPGQKIFDSGVRLDCDIRSCVFENIRGIYTCKLYAQPNITNAIRGTHDASGTVGRVGDVFFRNIRFLHVTGRGFGGAPVRGLFEICSDCRSLSFEDIRVDSTLEACDALDVKLLSIGPLSGTWKNGSENPADWGEIFNPDAVCRADGLLLRDIRFAGVPATDASRLIRCVRMERNPLYPRTTPRGGSGYGSVGAVRLEGPAGK